MASFLRMYLMDNGEMSPPINVDIPKADLKRHIDKYGNVLLYKGLM